MISLGISEYGGTQGVLEASTFMDSTCKRMWINR